MRHVLAALLCGAVLVCGVAVYAAPPQTSPQATALYNQGVSYMNNGDCRSAVKTFAKAMQMGCVEAEPDISKAIDQLKDDGYMDDAISGYRALGQYAAKQFTRFLAWADIMRYQRDGKQYKAVVQTFVDADKALSDKSEVIGLVDYCPFSAEQKKGLLSAIVAQTQGKTGNYILRLVQAKLHFFPETRGDYKAVLTSLYPEVQTNAPYCVEVAQLASQSTDTNKWGLELSHYLVKLDPANPRCAEFHLDLCSGWKLSSEALAEARRIVKKFPDNTTALHAAIKFFEKQMLTEEAIDACTKAIAVDPKSSEARSDRVWLAKLYETAGKNEEAIATWEELEKDAKDNMQREEAQKALEKLRQSN